MECFGQISEILTIFCFLFIPLGKFLLHDAMLSVVYVVVVCLCVCVSVCLSVCLSVTLRYCK